ncbi:MAG: TolC family protein [Muribaculaceae bacterium]|nr:TolC family protein [Muribaculaceae bacterium]
MKKIAEILLPALAVLSPLMVFASDPYSEICETILYVDPALKAQRVSSMAALEAVRADNALDNPEVEFGYKWGSPASADVNKWDLSVSQSFDWPGVYSARRRAIGFHSLAAQESTKAWILSRESEIRLLLVDYTAASRRAALLEWFAANVDSLYSISAKAYDLRKITVLDFRKVRVERELAAAKLAEERTRMSAIASQLRSMNGNNPVDLSNISDYPSDVLGEFNPDAAPSLASARWNLEAARADASAAYRSRMPGFSLGYVHEVEGREHFNGFSIGLSLPIWKGRKENIAARMLAEAEAESLASRHRQLEAEYSALRETAISLSAQADRISDAIGDNDEYLRLLDKALAGGTITLYQYFYEINTLLDARLTAEDLRAEAARAAQTARRYM